MHSQLKISLQALKDKGEIPVDETVEKELFPDALSEGALIGTVTVKGRILPVDDTAVFEGAAKGLWRFECVRCLTPVEAPWTAPVEAEAPIDAGHLDLTEEIRQSISLAQPMKIVCRPDCKGLCAVCRQNRNQKDCGHKDEGPQMSQRPRLTIRPDKG